MPRRDFVTAALPDGELLHFTRSEASGFVRDGDAEWTPGYEGIRLNQRGAMRARGLSCRVGAELAKAVRRKRSWALVMLADIQKWRQPDDVDVAALMSVSP